MNHRTHPARRLLGLALLLPLIALTAVAPAPRSAAQAPPYSPALQWGPSSVVSDMRPPLNDERIAAALDLAVDERAISQQVFGDPSLLVYAFRQEREGKESLQTSVEFDPEQARLLLEAADSRQLSLTIAYYIDPDTPGTAEAAKAIAADLEKNIGAHVRLLENDEYGGEEPDLLLTGPAGGATTGSLSLDIQCSPTIFRPDTWVVVGCQAFVANDDAETLTNVRLYISDPETEVMPEFFFVSLAQNEGNAAPEMVDPKLLLTFGEVQALEPGESLSSQSLVLLKMPQGRYESRVIAEVDGEGVMSVPFGFTSSPDAAAPPTDLAVDILSERREGDSVTYETKITNQSSASISWFGLQLYPLDAPLSASQPPPGDIFGEANLAKWSLASFGKEALAPGKSLLLQTTFSAYTSCARADYGLVVDAVVNGQWQFYGAKPSTILKLGECRGQRPSGLSTGGSGPGGRVIDLVSAIATLTILGTSLIILATALRGRPRR